MNGEKMFNFLEGETDNREKSAERIVYLENNTVLLFRTY